MPIITIKIANGKKVEQKPQLVEAITRGDSIILDVKEEAGNSGFH